MLLPLLSQTYQSIRLSIDVAGDYNMFTKIPGNVLKYLILAKLRIIVTSN